MVSRNGLDKSIEMNFSVKTLEDSADVAVKIAEALVFPSCIYIEGAMGAGKTTLTTYILKCLGYNGAVTSPTYNLIQEYPVDGGTVYHMDLYRVDDPSELEFLAFEDLWNDDAIFIIEWPSKGRGFLPNATHTLSISVKTEKAIEIRDIAFK